MNRFDVFLSFKNSDEHGNKTPEVSMAEELYESLTNKGINVFFSNYSIGILGAAQYKAAIDSALDDASLLVAIGTSAENLNSNWVRYEWDGFYGDILSGQKEGQVISYIDNMSTMQLPRTLRQLQSFERKTGDCSEITSFILNALGRSSSPSHNQKTTNIKRGRSTYSFLDDKEKERLTSQAKLVEDNDVKLFKELLAEKSPESLNVLDLGCADGYLTKRIFDNFSDRIKNVVGVDYQESCINDAKASIKDSKYSFIQLDLEGGDWSRTLEEAMCALGIQKFDIVFSALMFHHLHQPEKVLKKIRKYIAEDGLIYVRTCDDDEIEAFPDENSLVKETLLSTYNVSGMSDRIHGKKLFGQLYRSGYRDIHIKSYYVTTAQMNVEERLRFFFDIFYWRKNRLKKQLDLDPANNDYLNAYTTYCEKMEEIEDLFYSPDFYFRVAGPIAIAYK